MEQSIYKGVETDPRAAAAILSIAFNPFRLPPPSQNIVANNEGMDEKELRESQTMLNPKKKEKEYIPESQSLLGQTDPDDRAPRRKCIDSMLEHEHCFLGTEWERMQENAWCGLDRMVVIMQYGFGFGACKHMIEWPLAIESLQLPADSGAADAAAPYPSFCVFGNKIEAHHSPNKRLVWA